MAGPAKQYTKEMNKKFGYFATWEPNRPLALGDVGVLNKNIFTRLFNIERRFKSIKYKEFTDNSTGSIEYNSAGSVSFSTKLAGAVPNAGSVLTETDAGISIEFTSENAVVFKANETITPSIDDTVALGDKITSLYFKGKWKKEWVVITEIIKAKSATIFISNKKGSKIELKANSNITAQNFDIADASFNFSQAAESGISTKIIANEGLTPLFKVMGLRKRLANPIAFRPKRLARMADPLSPGVAHFTTSRKSRTNKLKLEDIEKSEVKSVMKFEDIPFED